MSKKREVYYVYMNPDENTTEVFHNGEIEYLDTFNVIQALPVSTDAIVFVNRLEAFKMFFPGGTDSYGASNRLNVTETLGYKYGEMQLRSFTALIGNESESLLKEIYPDLPMSVAMCEYVNNLGSPISVRYTQAYHAKKRFFDPIKDELWQETKKHAHYYFDLETYNDMMVGNKGGMICRDEAKYCEDVLMYDKKSAYPSYFLNDKYFPIGTITKSKENNKYNIIQDVISSMNNRNWCKLVFDGMIDGFELFYDYRANKTGIEFWDLFSIDILGQFNDLCNLIISKDVRLYTTRETNYTAKAFRDRIYEKYNEKNVMKKGTFARHLCKTEIDMIFGKGIQQYNFESKEQIRKHYSGRGENYVTPEMSNHVIAAMRYDMICAMMCNEHVYYDTDGIKVKDNITARTYFEQQNVKIIEKNRKSGYDSDIGIWDFEGNAERFIVFVPKIYAFECEGNLTLKHAGMPRKEANMIIDSIQGDKMEYIRHGLPFIQRYYAPVFGEYRFEQVYNYTILRGDLSG